MWTATRELACSRLREELDVGQAVEVGVLRPDERTGQSGRRAHDTVREWELLLDANLRGRDGERTIEVDDLALVHQGDRLQRIAFASLPEDDSEHSST